MVRNRGSVLAVGVALLALVIASTGTAVAVTYQPVRITDPVHASYKAQVDSRGRLATVGPPAGFNSAFYSVAGSNNLVGPTSATLVLTRLSVMNTALNAGFASTNFFVQVRQRTVGTNGTCAGAGNVAGSMVSEDRVAVGGQVQDTYPSGLVFRPVGGKAYCIDVTLSGEGGTPSTYYLPFVQVTGYVASGTFTAPGFAIARSAVPPKATRSVPRPQGVAPSR